MPLNGLEFRPFRPSPQLVKIKRKASKVSVFLFFFKAAAYLLQSYIPERKLWFGIKIAAHPTV